MVAARLSAMGRHVHLLVPFEQADHFVQIGNLAEQCFQLFDFRRHPGAPGLD
jgi:hypothetical protein